MEAFILYLGKAALAMAAFFLAFLILFQKQKHFVFNRIYLLASMVISYLIPLITFTIVQKIEAAPIQPEISYTLIDSVPYSFIEKPVTATYDWYHYLIAILLFGVAGFFIHFLLGNFKALNIVRKSYRKKELGMNVCITKEDVHPFSFFNKVIVSEKNLDHPNLTLILEHEKLHVKEKHTFDILFAELLFLLQWFNPFAWLLKDAVKNNLEYLTDDFITQQNDRESYQLAMVSLADKKGVAPFLTALNGSQLKNRIIMMKKKKENKFAVVKQLLLLPLLAILIMGLSNKEVKTEIIETGHSYDNEFQNILKTETIKGKVTDENGRPPIATAMIVEYDSNEKVLDGCTSDVDGNFSYVIKNKNSVIKCICLGYETVKLDTKEKQEFNIRLKREPEIEINVIGESKMKDDSSMKNKIIKGKVTDKKGKPIIGAMLIEYDKDRKVLQGITTDANGEFKFKTESGNSIIKCSARGFQEKEIEIKNKKELTVVLQKESKNQDKNLKVKYSGKVTDEKGNVLQGTSVVLKGKSIGTITDDNGYFEIYAEPFEDVVLFIHPEMKTQKVPVDKPEINVQLKELSIEERFFQGLPDKEQNIQKSPEQDLQNEIKGKVTDENGKPLENVSIYYTDRKKVIDETKSDKNGNYKINVKIENALLFFRLYGYRSKSFEIKKSQNLNVQIEKSDMSKEDMFFEGWTSEGKVTGYQKPDSILKIDSKIRVRGLGSITGNEPLYIVDGKITEDISSIDSESILSISVLKDKSATELYGEKAKDGVILITTDNGADQGISIVVSPQLSNQTDKDNKEKIYFQVDEMPQYPGGELALRKFLAEKVKYPVIAQENGIQGKVFVTFEIDKKGKVKEAQINKGVDPSLDKEALRVVHTLPRWKPGRIDGKPVNTWYTVPVIFKLQNPVTRTKKVIGYSSEESKNPLVVIDGKVTDHTMNDLNNSINNIENISVLKGESATSLYGERGKNGVVLVVTNYSNEFKPTKNSKVYNKEELFFEGGSMPKFLGGETALKDYINKNVRYPVIAQENGIHGKVMVSFVIDQNGNVKNPDISKGIDPSLDKEALRVVHTLPEFVPGTLKGEAVNVLYTVPVNFVIQNQSITSELELRKFIATNIKYPKKEQESNTEGLITVYAKVDQNGRITEVNEESANNANHIGQVVVTALKSENPNKNTANDYSEEENSLVDETIRVVKTLPRVDISEFKKKTIGISVKFVLQ